MTNRPRPPVGLLSCAATARLLSRSPATILAWAERGEFVAPVVINARNYFFEDQVLRWLADLAAAKAPLTRPERQAPNA